MPIPVQSQQHQVDSLAEVLDHISDTEKFDVLVQLTKLSGKSDNRRALEFAEQARDLALHEGDSLHIVTSSRLVGQLFNRLSRYKDAEAILLEILPVAERNGPRHDYKLVLGNLAVSYTFQAKYDKALEYNFEALELQRADANPAEQTHVLTNIGVVYYKLKDYEKSLEYLLETLALRKKEGITESFDQALMNASLAYAHIGDLSHGQVFADSALTTCMPDCPEEITMQYYYNSGFIDYELKRFDAAEQNFLRSYRRAQKINPRFQIDNIIYLSMIYMQRGLDDLALKYLEEAETIKEPFNLEMTKVYDQFIRLYKKKNDIEKLAAYQLKYIQLKDSTFNEEMTISLMKAESRFREQENKLRIQSQTELLVLKEQAISNQRLLIGMMSLAVLIMGVIVVLLMRNFYRKKKANKLIAIRIEERSKEIKNNYVLLRETMEEKDKLVLEAGSVIQRSLEDIQSKCKEMASFNDSTNTQEHIFRLNSSTEEATRKLQGLTSISNALLDIKPEVRLKG